MAACRMNDKFHHHIAVLLKEAVNGLAVSEDGIYVDATFGRGSHSLEILKQLGSDGRLIAFDKDADAVAYGKQHIQDKRFTILHCSFARMQVYLNELNVFGKVNGILFDLGVSSPQLDNPERGFSFVREGRLDMRMDTSQGVDAMQWLAEIGEKELADVLWQYGEERHSRRIARAIKTAQQTAPISTTKQLAEIIGSVMPRSKKEDKHPATRSFQAIRIAVNHELAELECGLSQALDSLAVGGRMSVISFHSLEDRLVKHFIRREEKGEELPRGLPVKYQAFQGRLKSIGKAIKPSQEETDINPRARSAVLRIAEKLS